MLIKNHIPHIVFAPDIQTPIILNMFQSSWNLWLARVRELENGRVWNKMGGRPLNTFWLIIRTVSVLAVSFVGESGMSNYLQHRKRGISISMTVSSAVSLPFFLHELDIWQLIDSWNVIVSMLYTLTAFLGASLMVINDGYRVISPFSTPFFCKEWLFSPELSGQPAFKFDKDMDVRRICCMILRNMPLDVEWVHVHHHKF
jgi:hypothetical protein